MLAVARWRIILVVVVSVLGALFAMPNLLTESQRAALPAWMPKQALNLGLDLQGGSHLLLEIDTPTLLERRLEKISDEMETVLSEADPAIDFELIGVDGETAAVRLFDPADSARAITLLDGIVTQVPTGGFGGTIDDVAFTTTPDGVIEARVTERALELHQRQAIAEAIEVIRRRIDPTGTSEVSITRQGQDRITVQAPGETNPELLKQRIGQTALLTFHMVDEGVTASDVQSGLLPFGTVVLPYTNPAEGGVAVRERPTMEGGNLTQARTGQDPQTGEWTVNFRLDAEGTRIFRRITTENIGKRFAIVLDGKVLSAPAIREPIIAGSGQISGGFTADQVSELSLLLRAGALPAPLTVIEQRSVGAELGADAVNAGATAGVLAAVGVLVFMLLAYGLFGIFGCIALVVNMTLIVGAMSLIGATLTLPGIAGLILTMAMAVDANVLIYERMREEALLGRGPALAIDAGFSRAMVTIIDANLTTIIAAAILFQFGAGPVRGFAWTLSIGVITSVFTAVLITQILVALWFRVSRPKQLPI
ncbi:MAG: protein translocase subunit SecD [Caulobacterales bacterium]